jgi:hypothetical protein
MLSFARYVTPVIAFAVLVIGLISASYSGEGTSFRFVGFFQEAIPTYFLAKTLFCSTTLVVLGQLLAEVIRLNRSRDQTG